MPECCNTCVCSEGYGCGITGTEMTTKEMESRPDWCPLEEVESCDDAVSREAVSSWLKQYGQDVLHGKYKFSLMYIWKNLIDLPPVQPEQRWIPVSERLPEDFKKVLVFWWEHSEPMIDTAFWQKDAKRFDGQHWVRIEDKITHWMPLPEPARLEND